MNIEAPLPTGIIVVLALVAALAVMLDVVALMDLYRRKPGEVVFGNKWIWLAIIVLLNLLGPVLYLVAGRQHAPGPTPLEREPGRGTAGIADKLYGPRQDRGQD